MKSAVWGTGKKLSGTKTTKDTAEAAALEEGGQDLCEGAHSDGRKRELLHSPHDLRQPSQHPAAKEGSLWQGQKARKGTPLGHRPEREGPQLRLGTALATQSAPSAQEGDVLKAAVQSNHSNGTQAQPSPRNTTTPAEQDL